MKNKEKEREKIHNLRKENKTQFGKGTEKISFEKKREKRLNLEKIEKKAQIGKETKKLFAQPEENSGAYCRL